LLKDERVKHLYSLVSNETIVFKITGPVRIKDSVGKVIHIRQLVEIDSRKLKKAISKYGQRMILSFYIE